MATPVVRWVRWYRVVDGFRFDLMGHHPRAVMERVAALDELTMRPTASTAARLPVREGWNR